MRTIQQHEETLRANMGIIQHGRASLAIEINRINKKRSDLDTFQAEFDKAAAVHRAAIRDDLKRY